MFPYLLTLNLQASLCLKWMCCRQYIDGSCFFLIHSDTFCLLVRVFSPFIFRVIIDRYVFSDVLLLVLSLYLEIFSVPFFSFLLLVLPLHLKIPFNISCRAALVVMNSFTFCLSGKLFISAILIDSLAGHSLHGCRFFPSSLLNISCHSLLACQVYVC